MSSKEIAISVVKWLGAHRRRRESAGRENIEKSNGLMKIINNERKVMSSVMSRRRPNKPQRFGEEIVACRPQALFI